MSVRQQQRKSSETHCVSPLMSRLQEMNSVKSNNKVSWCGDHNSPVLFILSCCRLDCLWLKVQNCSRPTRELSLWCWDLTARKKWIQSSQTSRSHDVVTTRTVTGLQVLTNEARRSKRCQTMSGSALGFIVSPSWIPGRNYISTLLGVTIRFAHLDGNFWPWRHVESTKQGEFLFSCIHFATMDPLLTTGSMYLHGFWKYRPRGTISTGLRHCRWRCDRWQWHPGYPQNKVSSWYHVYILQTTTMYLPLNRFVNLELGDIILEGRYRRIAPSSTTLRSTLVLPKSTKQGEFCFSCIHFANRNHILTSWSMYPHGFWKYRLRRTISTDLVIVDSDVVVFLVVRSSAKPLINVPY
jgi:hypothetical protein